jgi:predicted HAD superfamily Cof-like phosphohydrolase
MTFTHRHADGGFYTYVGPQEGKMPDDRWAPGVAYKDGAGKMYWTHETRWRDRFEELPPSRFKDSLEVNVGEDDHIIASYLIEVEDVGSFRHMVISSVNVAKQTGDRHTAVVLKAQAEMLAKGLHLRTVDFPDMIGDVRAFHEKFGQHYDGKPRQLPEDLHDFRTKFHVEETSEYADEFAKLIDAIARRDRRDIINCLELQLDALVDAAFVILGTADLQFGRDRFIEAWRRVVKANMLKVKKRIDEEQDVEDSGRQPKYDVVKPAGWLAPDHRDLVQDNAIFDEIFAADIVEVIGYNDVVL